MSESGWVPVEVVSGDLQAEILRGFLEAQGLKVMLSQEGAGRAIGINVGPLGEVQILVPASSYQEARELLDDYYAGEFDKSSNPSELNEDNPPEESL